MPVTLDGAELGIISNASRSVSGNERERTDIGDAEMMFAPGKPEREITLEVVGSLPPVGIGHRGQLVATSTEGGFTEGDVFVTELEETLDTGDGPGYSMTLKKARPQ